MTSTESIKYIISDKDKKAIKEVLVDVKKLYQVLLNLKIAGINRSFTLTFKLIGGECDTSGTILTGSSGTITLKLLFITSFVNEQFMVTMHHSLSLISQQMIAVLEYITKYLTKTQKKNPDITFIRVCGGCDKNTTTWKKCVCRHAFYCSKECQRSDWNKHKTECKQICAK